MISRWIDRQPGIFSRHARPSSRGANHGCASSESRTISRGRTADFSRRPDAAGTVRTLHGTHDRQDSSALLGRFLPIPFMPVCAPSRVSHVTSNKVTLMIFAIARYRA
jgi:hypothetical protein